MRTARLWMAALVVLVVVGPVHAGRKVRLRLEVPAKSLRGIKAVQDRAVLEAFRAANPDVEIEPYIKLRMQGPRGEATFYMSMAGETAPDALYVYGRSMQKYIDQDFLYPLNEYLKDDQEILQDPVFQKFLPAISRVYPLKEYLKRHPEITAVSYTHLTLPTN